MRIPTFSPADDFIQGAKIPCMVATCVNSSLPRVATRHIVDFESDPKFAVYLRAASVGEITEWQLSILQQLFEKEEIPRIIEKGMTALEVSVFGEHHWDADVQQHGMLPFLYVTAIVIDEITNQVFISLDTEKGFKPHEREIVIYRKTEGDWDFDDGDYTDRYLDGVAVDRFLAELAISERSTKGEAAVAPATDTTNPRILYGRWVFDEKSTARLESLRGFPGAEGESWSKLRGLTYEFSKGRYRSFADWRISSKNALWHWLQRQGLRLIGQSIPSECIYLGCELRGDLLTVIAKEREDDQPVSTTYRFKNDKLILVPELWVLSRVKGQSDEG